MTTQEATGASSPLSAGRIQSLDGLRAFSISLVFLAHLCGTQAFPLSMSIFRVVGGIGNLGVRVFFVISGFLITSLLLDENARTGRISLRNFYVRRILRIFPAAYGFIAVVWAATLVGMVQVGSADFLAACTYTMNYLQPAGWNLGHLWSLAVEEQFYIIWPLALCLSGRRRGMIIAGTMFLLGPSARCVSALWMPDSVWLSQGSFLANADALASGCLLSGLWGRLGASKPYTRFQRSWFFLGVPLIACACVASSRYMLGMKTTVLNVCIALCIDWCVRRRGTIIGHVLNWRPIAFVGVLSYSLYLWQQLFLNRSSLNPVNAFPLNVLLAFACALGSFFLIEKQFLKLRKHFLSAKPFVDGSSLRSPKFPQKERAILAEPSRSAEP